MKIKLDENLPARLMIDERHSPGTDNGILVLRLSDDRSSAVAERLALVFAGELVETWSGCIVIATDHKIRVRREQPRTE